MMHYSTLLCELRVCVFSGLSSLPLTIFRNVESAFSMQEVFSLFFHRITKKSGDFAGTCLQIPLKYFGINLITSNLINYCKKNNIKVHVWTINDEAVMARLVELGINGIMTDKCRSLLKVLKK